ncbi:MAG: hypothetical protein II234_00005, partial [Clostridia bacterium]|nr:hypothetical protein [Clostridia bacterium]
AEQKKELEIGLWLYTLNNSKDALRSQESKIAAAQLSYRQIEESLEEFDRKTEQNTAYFAKLTSDIEGERLNISSTNEEILKSNGEITVIKNDIQHNEENIDRLNEEKNSLSATDAEAISEIESQKALAAEKEAKKKELEEKLHSLEEQLSELLSDSDSISRKIENQIKELNILSGQAADMRVKKVTADTAISEIESRQGSAESQREEYSKEIDSLTHEFEETDNLIKTLDENIQSFRNSLKGYEMLREAKEKSAEELKEKLDTQRLDIEAKKRRVQILKELEDNMEGFGHAVKSVMKEAEIGTLGGICGPVSKLIKVEKEYSIAVETALSNAIQNVITETEADAKKAINFLKSSKGGRATFLPVATIKAREFKEHGFEDMTGYVGIASDLVVCDEKYREIIKYLLGGAVVAEDIDCAAAIAKKFGYRIKIVTLDGQVINPGGSLTGGSLIKNAGLLSRGADIEKMESDILNLSEKEKELNEKYNSATSSAAAVNADITAVSAEISTANEDKIRALAELKRIGDMLNSLKSELAKYEQENNANIKKVEELTLRSKEAESAIAQIEEKKSGIQSEIDRMTGGRDNLNETREELSSEITRIKLSVIELQKDIEACISASNNLEALIQNRGKRAEEIDKMIEALKGSNTILLEKIGLIEEKIKESKEKITVSEKSIEDMLEKRNQTEKAGVELRSSEREKTSMREKIGGELARLTERKEIMLKDYDDVIRKLYDEYELTRSEAEKIGIEIERPTEAKKTLAEIKGKIRSLGNVNVSAIEEYKEVKERYDFLSAQIEDVENTRAELHKLINQLTTQMQDIFTEGFAKI